MNTLSSFQQDFGSGSSFISLFIIVHNFSRFRSHLIPHWHRYTPSVLRYVQLWDWSSQYIIDSRQPSSTQSRLSSAIWLVFLKKTNKLPGYIRALFPFLPRFFPHSVIFSFIQSTDTRLLNCLLVVPSLYLSSPPSAMPPKKSRVVVEICSSKALAATVRLLLLCCMTRLIVCVVPIVSFMVRLSPPLFFPLPTCWLQTVDASPFSVFVLNHRTSAMSASWPCRLWAVLLCYTDFIYLYIIILGMSWRLPAGIPIRLMMTARPPMTETRMRAESDGLSLPPHLFSVLCCAP